MTRKFSSGYVSRLIINKDSIYTENPNISRNQGFITLENCIPYQKNQKVARVFREMGLADELGSGVRNMTYYSNIYSGKNPIIEDGNMFKVTIPLIKSISEENLVDSHKDSRKNDEIIFKLCEKEKTMKEIMEYMGYKDVGFFKRTYIDPLLKSEKLKQTVPDKPTRKNQKYIKNDIN